MALISSNNRPLQGALIRKVVTINDLKDFTAEEIKSIASCTSYDKVQDKVELLKASKQLQSAISTDNTPQQQQTTTEKILSQRSKSPEKLTPAK